MSAPDIAGITAELFRQRQHRARLAVRDGAMDARTAAAHLKPWLAIACRCGADLPELEEGIADRRQTQLVAGNGCDITEGEARALLADEICPRSRWAPILAKARDAAMNGPHATQDQRDAAIALRDIANHLAFDPNGRHHVPLWTPPGAQERAAA